MAYCDNCGSEIGDNAKICPVCGAEMEDMAGTDSNDHEKREIEEVGDPADAFVFCPECGCKNAEGGAFCEACGAPLTKEAEAIKASQTVTTEARRPVQENGEKTHGKRPVFFLAAGAAAVAVIGGAAFALPRLGGSEEAGVQGGIYEKDNTLYYTDGKKTLEITDSVAADTADTYIHSSVEYSEDGRYIYYTAKNENSGTGTLYRKDLKKESEKNDTEEKIASGVSFIKMAGDRLFYVKNGNLYVYENGETEKLAKDFMDWRVSKDGTRLLYTDSQQRLYYMPVLEERAEEKVASDCMYLLSCTDDLKVAYYQDDSNNLYVVREGVKEKIASDVIYAVPYGNKQFVYYETKGDDFSLTRLFDDDMALQDAQCSEPRREDYNRKWNGSFFSFDSAGFNAARDAYKEKRERDEIRSQIISENPVISRSNLYVYDGTESRLLAENIWGCHETTVCQAVGKNAPDNYEPAICVENYAEEDLPRIRISEMDSSVTLSSLFYKKKSEENVKRQISIVSDGCIAALESDNDWETFYVDTVNRVIYREIREKTVEDGADVWKTSEFLKIPYSEKGAGEAVTLDDDIEGLMAEDGESVYSSCMLVKDGKLYYLADYDWDRMEGSLRCDGQEVMDDVDFFYEENGILFVEYDYNTSSYCSSLGMIQKDGTVTELGEDVYHALVLPDGSVMYLADYDYERLEGDLYLWKKG
ncbi:MAG: zinc-ribbon domain-containing protein, partial [Clostridium sp.]